MAKKQTQEDGDISLPVNLAQELADAKFANEALMKQLGEMKLRIKQVLEQNCLRDLQEVLDEHQCQLVPQPDGKFAVLAKE